MSPSGASSRALGQLFPVPLTALPALGPVAALGVPVVRSSNRSGSQGRVLVATACPSDPAADP
jgi:hypothetical protein